MSVRVDLSQNKDEVWMVLPYETTFVHVSGGDGVCLAPNQPQIAMLVGYKRTCCIVCGFCNQGLQTVLF
jgi:hypothetical protein